MPKFPQEVNNKESNWGNLTNTMIFWYSFFLLQKFMYSIGLQMKFINYLCELCHVTQRKIITFEKYCG